MWSDWIADVLLRGLGDEPIQYYPEDKWPAIFAILSDFIVPYGQIILFVLPFIALKLFRKKFTLNTIAAGVVLGAMLALLAYVFDEWLLIWGQGAAFYDIHGISRENYPNILGF